MQKVVSNDISWNVGKCLKLLRCVCMVWIRAVRIYDYVVWLNCV